MSGVETFMVFELDDEGERVQIDISREELEENLHPENVLVIVREELRRIFIWKGPKSPVRKRFISSRVASALQEELMKDARYHRCKIVSVDAGDEPAEFLRAFRIESMDVSERLEDMRYVRNVEREGLVAQGSVVESKKTKSPTSKETGEEEDFSPALQEAGQKVAASTLTKSSPKPIKQSKVKSTPFKPQSKQPSKQPKLSNEKIEKLKEKILKTELSGDYKRLNLILGHTLYAAVSKTANIFGKDVVETNWEAVKKVPEGMMKLEDHVLRVYFDAENGLVEALEVLEKNGSANTKSSPKKTQTKKPAPKKKGSLTPMPTKPKAKAGGRRQLPKIPSDE